MNLFLKRALDIALSALASILLIPLWVIVAVIIKLDSTGPIFFVQARRTKDGRVFDMYKFRSMLVNAEQMGAGLFNFADDPRVTKVGSILRKSSIDELPQLFNILKGDMSMVGPRPCTKDELGEYETLSKKYKKRFEMKAGLTGLAQVKGRNNISWDDKVTYDNQYIDLFRKYGIFIDIRILFESVLKVLKRENTYEHKLDVSLDDAEAARLAEAEIIQIAHLEDEA